MRLLSLFPTILLAATIATAAHAASLPLVSSSDDVLLSARARGCDLLSACFTSLKNTLRGVSSVPEVPGRTSTEHRYSSIALSRMPSHGLSHSSSGLGAGAELGLPSASPPRPPRHSPRSTDKGMAKGEPMLLERPLREKPRPELARAKSPIIAPTAAPSDVKMARGRGRKNGGKVPYLPPPPSGRFGSGTFGYGSAAAQERVWKGAQDDVTALRDGSSSQDRKSTLAALKGKNGAKKPALAR